MYEELEMEKNPRQSRLRGDKEDWILSVKEETLESNRYFYLAVLWFSFWARWTIRSLGVTGSSKVTQNVCECKYWEKLVLFVRVQHYLLSHCVGYDQRLDQLNKGIACSMKHSLHWKFQLWVMPEVSWRSTKMLGGGWNSWYMGKEWKKLFCSA